MLLGPRKVLLGRNPQEQELRPLNEQVADAQRIIRESIVEAPAEPSPRTCRIPFSVFAGEEDAVVPRSSAQAGFPDPLVLPGDHFTIARPTSHEHRTYTSIKRLLLLSDADPRAEDSDNGPWLRAQDVRRSWSEHSVFTHRWQFVGRQQLLKQLIDFALADTRMISLVVGRGGIGKTRLLLELDRLETGRQVSVRVFEPDADFGRSAKPSCPARNRFWSFSTMPT